MAPARVQASGGKLSVKVTSRLRGREPARAARRCRDRRATRCPQPWLKRNSYIPPLARPCSLIPPPGMHGPEQGPAGARRRSLPRRMHVRLPLDTPAGQASPSSPTRGPAAGPFAPLRGPDRQGRQGGAKRRKKRRLLWFACSRARGPWRPRAGTPDVVSPRPGERRMDGHGRRLCTQSPPGRGTATPGAAVRGSRDPRCRASDGGEPPFSAWRPIGVLGALGGDANHPLKSRGAPWRPWASWR